MIDTRNSGNGSRIVRMGIGVHQACQIISVEIRKPKEKSLIEIWVKNSAGHQQKQTI